MVGQLTKRRSNINGAELGPTTPVNVAPGETIDIRLPAAGQSFETWSTHAEVG